MKKMLILMGFAALLLCGCKDDHVKVTREYTISVDLKDDYFHIGKTPQLDQLHKLLNDGIVNIRKQLEKKFTIVATGDSEEDASAQSEAQAREVYAEHSAKIKTALLTLQTSFNAKKAELLPLFTEDEKNRFYIDSECSGTMYFIKSTSTAPGYILVPVKGINTDKVTFVAGSKDVQ